MTAVEGKNPPYLWVLSHVTLHLTSQIGIDYGHKSRHGNPPFPHVHCTRTTVESTPRVEQFLPTSCRLGKSARFGGGGSWNEANRRSGAISCPMTSRPRRKLIPIFGRCGPNATAPIIILALIDTVLETVRSVDVVTTAVGVVPRQYFARLRCGFSAHYASIFDEVLLFIRDAVATCRPNAIAVCLRSHIHEVFANIAIRTVNESLSARGCSGICYVGPMLRRRT